MINPQVINLNEYSVISDTVLSIDGFNIIDTDGDPIVVADLTGTLVVMDFLNLIDTSVEQVTDIPMLYHELSGYWTITLSSIVAASATLLKDRNKYVAKVTEDSDGVNIGFQTFKIDEFVIDNEVIERGPFEVIADGTANSKIIWYSDTVGGTAVYEAPVYEGGTGSVNYASSPEKVTHRGPITAS